MLENAETKDCSVFLDRGGLSIDFISSGSTQAFSQDRALMSTGLNVLENPSVSVLIPNANAVAILESIGTPSCMKRLATRLEVAENSGLSMLTSAVTSSFAVWWSSMMLGTNPSGRKLLAPDL